MFTLGFVADSNGRYKSPTSTLCRAWKTNSQGGNSRPGSDPNWCIRGKFNCKIMDFGGWSLWELVWACEKNLCKIERPTWNPNKSVETLCFQWTDHFQVTCPIRWKTGIKKNIYVWSLVTHKECEDMQKYCDLHCTGAFCIVWERYPWNIVDYPDVGMFLK